MVDPIASAAISRAGLVPAASSLPDAADALARAGGVAVLDALTGADGPIGVPLRETAGTVSGAIAAQSGRTDAVGAAQLDRAVLDFAREAKAFAIGHAERGGEGVRTALDAALAAGAGEADRIAVAGRLDGADRIAVTFERAAAHLQTS